MSDILTMLVDKVITLSKHFLEVIVLNTPLGVSESQFDQVWDVDNLVIAAGSDAVEIEVWCVRRARTDVQTVLWMQPLPLSFEQQDVVT